LQTYPASMSGALDSPRASTPGGRRSSASSTPGTPTPAPKAPIG